MQLDSVTIALRPRNQWEAMDLGFRMVRAWWRPIFGPWLISVVGLTVLIAPLAWFGQFFLAVALIWWLKPILDRVPLFVLSHMAFGETPGIRPTLLGILPRLRRGAAWDLTFGRLDAARSFDMPVRDLEGLKGKARRSRIRTLQKEARRGAVWLTVVCATLQSVLYWALVGLLYFLWPHTGDNRFLATYFTKDAGPTLKVLWFLMNTIGLAIMEPFYVGAGFALYLNRRTLLEGWDIEIAFRRLAQRRLDPLPSAGLATGVAAFVLGGILALGCFASLPCRAADTPSARVSASIAVFPPVAALKGRIERVLHQRGFSQYKVLYYPKYIGKAFKHRASSQVPAWIRFFLWLGAHIARYAEPLMWVLVAFVLSWIYVKRDYWLRRLPRRIARDEQPLAPAFVATAESATLPDDIPAAALSLCAGGQVRAALSLLYRGALASGIAHVRGEVAGGATEADCMRIFRKNSSAAVANYFCDLTRAWQGLAYGGRAPAPDMVQRLCRDWVTHFGMQP